MMTAEILRPSDLTPGDLEAWATFRGAEPVFCNPLFGSRWVQAVGRVRDDARVAVFRREGKTVGFLAHHRDFGGYARPIGAPFSDLHALIADPINPITLSEAVQAAGLRSFRFSGLFEPGERDGPGTQATIAHVVERGPGDDLLEVIRARNPKRFKNWRRLGHKLEREIGSTALTAHDPCPEAYRTLIAWKRAQLRRSGLHDVYGPAWVRQLMDGLMDDPDPAFGGVLITLRAGGRLVAGEFGLREGGCFHPWIAAYEPDFAPYSPGILLQLGIIEEMERLELRRYDLGATSDHYKAPMASAQITLSSGVVQSRRPSAVAGALARTRLGARLDQRWEQIAAVETSAYGRMQGVLLAVRDGPKRMSKGEPGGAHEP